MYVAYASSWNTSIYDLTTVSIPNYITHLNLAFVRPDTTYIQGSYAFDQAVAGLEFVEGATTPNGQRKFTAQQSQDRNNIAGLRARGTKAFLSVGGWSYSQGSQWSRFNAKNIVDLALDHAAGVDIDWESSGAATKEQPRSSGAPGWRDRGHYYEPYSEIHARNANLQISIAGWSTGAIT